MPLVFGDKEALLQRDDIKGFLTRKLLPKVRKFFREEMDICEECGACDLEVISIFKNGEEDVLAWDSCCLSVHRNGTVFLTTDGGESYYELEH